MAKNDLYIVVLSHPCDHDIPYIDVHGCTNVVKPWMARNDLYIKTDLHDGATFTCGTNM